MLYKCCYIKCQAAANISIAEPLSHSKCVCQFSWVFSGVLRITDRVKLSATTAGAALGRVCHQPCGLASSKQVWPWENLGSSHSNGSEGVTNPFLFWKGSTRELNDVFEFTGSFVQNTFSELTLVLFYRMSGSKSTAEPQSQSNLRAEERPFPRSFSLIKER